MQHGFTYEAALAASERVSWKVEDLIGGDKTLNFDKAFLPEPLARTEGLAFLTPRERLVVNQLRGHNYLYLFGLVEEFILPFVLDHARPQLVGDDHRVRALLQFATEEAKHIHLFKCFRADFQSGFGLDVDVIGPPEEIAKAVLSHEPLAVALTILHIEWMTQRHYLESIRNDNDLDPLISSLLKHHWMEEAQHAKLDTLMVEALAEGRSPARCKRAVEEYLEIGMMLDGGLRQQVEFDLDAFERATGRKLDDDERSAFIDQQHQAMRWTFLGSGMTHPRFLESVEAMDPALRTHLEDVANAFC